MLIAMSSCLISPSLAASSTTARANAGRRRCAPLTTHPRPLVGSSHQPAVAASRKRWRRKVPAVDRDEPAPPDNAIATEYLNAATPTSRRPVGVESRHTRRRTRLAAMDSNGGFRVELLGPVEAWVDGRQVALGGQRPRALLAVLALIRGRVVSSERLIDELWGEDPPARARNSLQVHVSRLRKALTEAGGDADRLVGRSGGYVLELGPGARDVDRWEAALGRARQARAAGRVRGRADGDRGGARCVARSAVRGSERARAARWRARAARGGAPRRDDRGDRARPRAGPPRRAAGPARGAGDRASLQGAPGGAADAGAVSLRTTGRRAGGLPRRPRTVRGGARHRARPAAARAARGRPAPRRHARR